jgi:hypothetical protein
MAYVQDEARGFRLSLLVDRAHGASSFESGRLEVLIGRYLDGEESPDTTSNYVLLLEDLHPALSSQKYEDTLPTILAHHLSLALSYPVPVFLKFPKVVEVNKMVPHPELAGISLLNQNLPCDSHLINLRTLFRGRDDSNRQSDSNINTPGLSTLLITQKLGHTYYNDKSDFCRFQNGFISSNLFYNGTMFTPLLDQDPRLVVTDITGLRSVDAAKEGGSRGQRPLLLKDLTANPFEIKTVVIHFEENKLKRDKQLEELLEDMDRDINLPKAEGKKQ